MEGFIGEAVTAEGNKILLCGFCRQGESRHVCENYMINIKQKYFPKTADAFFADYCLSEIVKESSSEDIFLVGATIKLNGIADICGGVIGSPFEESRSAQDRMEYMGRGVFCASFGGLFGFAVRSKECEAERLLTEIKAIKEADLKNICLKAVKILRDSSKSFVFVSDGSGEKSFGCAAVADVTHGFIFKSFEREF